MENVLTRVAVVLDRASEDLLVVGELERGQPLVSQSLSCDDVDGRLVSSSTVGVGVVPIVRR